MSKLGFFGTKARTMNVSRKPTVTVEQEFNKEILQRLGNFPIKVQLSILSDLLPELQAHQSRLIAENDRKKEDASSSVGKPKKEKSTKPTAEAKVDGSKQKAKKDPKSIAKDETDKASSVCGSKRKAEREPTEHFREEKDFRKSKVQKKTPLASFRPVASPPQADDRATPIQQEKELIGAGVAGPPGSPITFDSQNIHRGGSLPTPSL